MSFTLFTPQVITVEPFMQRKGSIRLYIPSKHPFVDSGAVRGLPTPFRGRGDQIDLACAEPTVRDPRQTKFGKISFRSVLAQFMIGRNKGDKNKAAAFTSC
jgi:hypothetical protein